MSPACLGPAAALVRLSFLVQSVYADVCGRHDLTPQQAQLLCVVKDQPRGMAELTGILRLEKSSVSGLVDRVEQRGLVRRCPSEVDRRTVTVALTGPGARAAAAFHDEATERLLEVVDRLPPDDRERFTSLAAQLVLAEDVPHVFGATG